MANWKTYVQLATDLGDALFKAKRRGEGEEIVDQLVSNVAYTLATAHRGSMPFDHAKFRAAVQRRVDTLTQDEEDEL